ncbi:hypothetical protein Tco_1324526, partial [Tanacetum coccineum]
KAQEEVCQWRQLLLMLWSHVMVLVMTGVIRQRKDLLTISDFENASKSLDKLIDSQIVDNYKKGLGYNAVPPPYTGNFMPPTPDLSFTGLEEFTSEPVVIKPVVENSEANASEAKPKEVRKNNGALIIEDWVYDSEEENVPQAKIEKKTVKSSFAKIKFVKPKQQEKTARKTVNHQYQLILLDKLILTVNAARSMSLLSKTAHSTVKRPIHRNTTLKNSDINQWVNTVRGKNVNIARSKAVVNAVKASTCWVWKPKTKVLDHGNPQMDLQDQGVIDSGCSRHMTGNMSYLTDYEEIDG